MADKSHVKGSVVGHQRRIPHKFQKLGEDYVDLGIRQHHGVVDAGQLLNVKWDRHVRVHKGGKFIRDLPVRHLHRPDFNDPVLFWAEARGLDVKNHICIGKALVPGILHQLLGVVHQIPLHAVDDLEGISLVQGVVGVREGLYTAVVRHRDGGHSPFLGPLDDILHLGNAVHVAHLGMAVQLHPLLQTSVHALACEIVALLDAHNGAKGQLSVELVDGGHALDADEGAHVDHALDLLEQLRPHKHFHADGVREVRDVEGQDEFAAAQLPALAGEDLAPQGHLAHLPVDLLDLQEVVLEIAAIEHLRVVGFFDRKAPVPEASTVLSPTALLLASSFV